MNRLRDLGVMNLMGASKGQILRHFISESMIPALIVLFLGVILAGQLLPLFNNLAVMGSRTDPIWGCFW